MSTIAHVTNSSRLLKTCLCHKARALSRSFCSSVSPDLVKGPWVDRLTTRRTGRRRETFSPQRSPWDGRSGEGLLPVVKDGAGELKKRTVRRHEIAEENRLIVGMNHEVLSNRPGRSERSRLVSAERPRPSASTCGGGKSRGSGTRPGRRESRLASALPGALRAPSHTGASQPQAGKWACPCAEVGTLAGCFGWRLCPPKSRSGNSVSLYRGCRRTPRCTGRRETPWSQAAISGCTSRAARLRCTVGGGAGELQNVVPTENEPYTGGMNQRTLLKDIGTQTLLRPCASCAIQPSGGHEASVVETLTLPEDEHERY